MWEMASTTIATAPPPNEPQDIVNMYSLVTFYINRSNRLGSKSLYKTICLGSSAYFGLETDTPMRKSTSIFGTKQLSLSYTYTWGKK